MRDRKMDHIELAGEAQTEAHLLDQRFYYEPLVGCDLSATKPFQFELAGKELLAPLWISSMTGGIRAASLINKTLASAAAKYGLGMALGSIRMLLDGLATFDQFDVRDLIGDERPLFGNLGIAQVAQLLESGEISRLEDLVGQLRLDGLCLHVNPLQEWCQQEGDRFVGPAIDIIAQFTEKSSIKLIVKEVGQGMGPQSLRALMQLPLEAIEFSAFGGTNFSKLELLRFKNEWRSPIAQIGHSACEMVAFVNEILKEKNCACQKFIISGGIKNFLDGYFLVSKIEASAIYGQASKLLECARKGQECLDSYIEAQLEGWQMAQSYLRVR